MRAFAPSRPRRSTSKDVKSRLNPQNPSRRQQRSRLESVNHPNGRVSLLQSRRLAVAKKHVNNAVMLRRTLLDRSRQDPTNPLQERHLFHEVAKMNVKAI